MSTGAIVAISIGSASVLGVGGFFGFKWFKLRKITKI